METVYFTKKITSLELIKIYDMLNPKLTGNIAVKISTGEKGNPNHLNPELIKDLVHKLNGTLVECNTAYNGKREKTSDHREVIAEHGFDKIANVDIMDENGDFAIKVKDGKHLKENLVGQNLQNYDSMLVLSHFKGHPMGGFGGALKNMSIGVASRNGKALIHTAGKTSDANILWDNLPSQEDFLEAMAEADKAVIDYMQGKILYINVVNNLSVDCDCVAHPEKICMNDIGILASTDPVALDKACLDLIYNSNDEGKKHFIERVERQNGMHILDYAESINIGNKSYILKEID